MSNVMKCQMSWVHFAKIHFGKIYFRKIHIWKNTCIYFWRALLPSYIFEHWCLHTPEKHLGLHTPPEAFMPSYNPRFLFASHLDRLYMFLKSIAAIIHTGSFRKNVKSKMFVKISIFTKNQFSQLFQVRN